MPDQVLIIKEKTTCYFVDFIRLAYKDLSLGKKSSRTHAALVLVEKEEGIPDNTASKSYLLFLSRTSIEPSVRIRGPN